MNDSSPSEMDPLNVLAEEFLTRHRRGERPCPSEYADRHPDLAERIRELFPALLVLEACNPPPRDAPLPRQLGEYRLVREVGRGGMGVVYEAVQESLKRRVAVKVLSPTLCYGKQRERFAREAKAAARLHHTNIVPVFGVGEQDGQPYYVMQFIDGRGLDAVLRDDRAQRGGAALPPTPSNGALTSSLPGEADTPTSDGSASRERQRPKFVPPVAEAPGSPSLDPSPQSEEERFRGVARWGVQAAEALAHAHAQGVLHRDIKPSNLLLDSQGTLWIADFGLAKAGDGDDLTEQGDVVGTLRYLAPERFRGECDARADVYALGATLYELLTRCPAFDAANRAKLMEQILHHQVTPPRRLLPALPRDLEAIVLKAMAPEPADRYATAEALAEDLRRFLAGWPILARRSSLTERLRRWRRRNPVVAWLTSTVVVLTLLLALGSTVATLWLLHALSESERARKEQREQLWRSLIDQARANRRSGRIGQRLESLHLLKEAADIRGSPEIRNEVIACLALIDSEEVAHWPRPKDPDALAFDFDFQRRRYLQTNRKGEIRVRQLDDDAEIFRLDSIGELYPWGAKFSPDGRYLLQYAQPKGRQLVWDVTGFTPKLVFDDIIGLPRYYIYSFRDDGQRLAVIHEDGSVLLYDLAAGRRLPRLPPGSASAALAFHPRRPWLAFANGAILNVVNVEDGKEVVRLGFPSSLDYAAWHPDGVRLAASARDRKIYLWDVPARRPLVSFEGHKNYGDRFAFHPSGRVLHSNDWDERDRWWDVDSGRQLLCAAGNREDWLAQEPFLQGETSRTQLRLHRLVEQRVLRTLTYQTGSRRQRFNQARLDPSGRWLAAFSDQSGMVLFDLKRPAALSAVLREKIWPLTFDPSGALLLFSHKDLALARWPLADDGEGKVRLGPPETLFRTPRSGGCACTADGRLAALACFNEGTLLFDRDRPAAPRRLGPQGDVRGVAFSPDGRWVATSTHWDSVPHAGVKVWDVASGRLVKDLPLKSASGLAFSPDGRWLGVGDGPRCRFWRTGTWEEVAAVEGKYFAFGPDGVLAVGNGESIRLLDVDSWEEFARLEAPQETAPMPQCFSGDGSLLVAVGLESDTLLVWDLRALREELAARQLDWDRPPYPPAR